MLLLKVLYKVYVGFWVVFIPVYYYYHPYCLLVGIIAVCAIAGLVGIYRLIRWLLCYRPKARKHVRGLSYRASPHPSSIWEMGTNQQYIPRYLASALDLDEWYRTPVKEYELQRVAVLNPVRPSVSPQINESGSFAIMPRGGFFAAASNDLGLWWTHRKKKAA